MKLFLGMFLVLGAAAPAVACSDPELHKKHIAEEIRQAELARSRQQGGQPTQSQPAFQSALDSEESFFGSVGKQAPTSERRRR